MARDAGRKCLQVDGRVTRLWKFFFRPASGTTDRLGFSIPMGDVMDQVSPNWHGFVSLCLYQFRGHQPTHESPNKPPLQSSGWHMLR